MECCISKADKEQKRKNKEIEKQLKKDWKDAFRDLKILLIGTHQSGKSTFVKQMQIICGKGYSDEDKKSFMKLIYQTMFRAMQSMIKAMKILNIEYKDSSNHENADLVCSVDFDTVTTIENQFVEAIRALWNDPGIQECYGRRREYQLTDSAKYYLSDLDRITCSTYIPTEEDILRVSIVTTAINDYPFDIDSFIFRMIDVPQVRTNRRRWVLYFEDAAFIFFFAALSEYDQLEIDYNLMEDSKAMFKTILENRWFRYLPVILFLNKKDIFEEKIMVSHLVDYFPEYDGPKQDHIAAQRFILSMYLSLNQNLDHVVYSHFTCAVDTRDIRTVFAEVKDTIQREHWKKYNLKSCLL